jgi:ferritin-like metal-binding protein YciE
VEKHWTTGLPKMKKAATMEELKTAIGEHITQTEEHVATIKQVFEFFEKKPQAKKVRCYGKADQIR